ncbi:hypothetical protein CLA01_15630 [Chryseobacterium lathyri]|uniref:Uncharacterized protein n=1 Tax=Chryseobacterium lathyri TaxID=395933 RepID=A0A511Y8G8_9FLAO|nr:hypothetical protein CLA01_15630 [Chryseobacterium lathyri]
MKSIILFIISLLISGAAGVPVFNDIPSLRFAALGLELYTISPVAGFVIVNASVREVRLTRGGKNPAGLSGFACISNAAEVSGLLVFIPTCASVYIMLLNNSIKKILASIFLIFSYQSIC